MNEKAQDILACIVLILVICGFSTCMYKSCEQDQKEDQIREQKIEARLDSFLAGDHPLRRFKVKDETKSEAHGSYFLLSGSYDSKSGTYPIVTYSFLSKGIYYIAQIPYNKVQVVIDSTVQVPYIKFEYYYRDYPEISDILTYSIISVTVHCKEEDFKTSIEL